MACLICNEAAEDLPGFGGDYRYLCTGCGHFRISTSLFDEMNGRVFDLDRSRAELDRQRENRRLMESLHDRVPLLTSHNRDLLIEPA